MIDDTESATIHPTYTDTMPMVEVVQDEEDACFKKVPLQEAFDNFSFKDKDIEDIDDDEIMSGTVMFRGITRETEAKFIRVSESMSPDLVWNLMKDEKKLEITKPSLIVSVSGGCKDFKLPENLKSSFKATIQKASLIQDSLIISGGTYTGVMKIVSDAFVKDRGVCLGITAWDMLVSKDVSIKNDPENRYVVGSWLSENGLYLDYKHTHFIMVKEKTKNRGEMLFRTRLEHYLIKKHQCPAVLIVVNGGWGTLDTIHEIVTNGICPIVVVEKSGRVADMLSHAINHCHTIMEKVNSGQRHPDLERNIKRAIFNGKIDKEEDFEICYKKVIKCLENETMFSVAKMGSDNDIDAAVIKALLSGDISNTENETFEKLKLTLLWDRADYARENILSSYVSIKDFELNYLMIMALAHGNHKWVDLLMDYGVNMYELLTEEILEFIYGFQSKKEHFPLKNIIALKYKETKVLNENDRQGAQSIDGDVIRRFWEKQIQPLFLDNHIRVIKPFKKKKCFEDPFWELFLWAIVCNLPDMATFLWPFGRDQMAKALVASEVYKYLSKHDDVHKDDATAFSAGSDAFRLLAQQLLDTCFSAKEDDTTKLLTTTLRQVPNMTLIDIAGATQHHEFIAHNSVQTLSTSVWNGQINKRSMSRWDYIKVLFGIVFPFLILDDIDLRKKPNYYVDYTNDYKESQEKRSARRRWSPLNERGRKLISFYFETPLVSFILHVFGSLLFLMLYVYMTIWGQIGLKKTWKDILLVVWVFGHLAAEIYQVTQYDTKSVIKKLTYWFSDSYNKYDAANISAFFVAWGLSFHHDTMGVSRTLHALNCGCWILRAMTVVRIHPTFGLYLEMVQEMLKELFWFLFILFTVIFAYAVTSTAILHPGVPDPMVLVHMFLRSWFHVYGEYFIELPPGDNSTHLITPRYNSYDEYVVWVIFGFYLLLTNILLLNIIIAAFNTTYANIQEKSSVISKFRRFDLIVEYSKRVSTPPPLSLVQHIGILISECVLACVDCCRSFDETGSGSGEKIKGNTKLRQELKTVDLARMEQLREFEYCCAKQLCAAESAESAIVQETPNIDLNRRIAKLESKLLVSIEKLEERMFDKLEAKLSDLEHRVDRLSEVKKER